jgi:hypothetical protein
VDLANLEASVQDFFDEIAQLNQGLSTSKNDVLYALGIMTVAAAVAVEIVRVQVHPAVAAIPVRGPSLTPTVYEP